MWKGILCAAAVGTLAACHYKADSDSSHSAAFPAHSVGADSGMVTDCSYVASRFKTMDERLAAGVPLVFGTVESVRFEDERIIHRPDDSDGPYELSGEECPKEFVRAAVVLEFRVEESVYPELEGQVVSTWFWPDAWEVGYDAMPVYNSYEDVWEWSDGKDYFEPGTSLGMFAWPTEEGYLNTQAWALFLLDDAGRVLNDAGNPSRCLEGTLVGREWSSLMEQAKGIRSTAPERYAKSQDAMGAYCRPYDLSIFSAAGDE